MKYAIVYLIRGKAEKYHQKLVREVGPKFGENYLLENPLPSHVTLKSPFRTNKIKKIELLIRAFVKKQHQYGILMGNFGNFRKFVIFSKTKFSRPARKIQKNLIKELKKLKGLKFQRYDLHFKPHATIAYGNTKINFNLIWNYLKKKNKQKFNLKFDNISIIRKPKYWEIYKIYKIN